MNNCGIPVMGAFACGTSGKRVLRKPLRVPSSQHLKLVAMLRGQHVQRPCDERTFDYREKGSVLRAQREKGVRWDCRESERPHCWTL